MTTNPNAPKTIDEYIAGFSPDIQEILQTIRATIRKAAPQTEEDIRYNIPTFLLKGRYLIYFAAFKKHISLYPVAVGNPELDDEISPYLSGKGTLQFPLSEPIPYKLVTKIVKSKLKKRRSVEEEKGRKTK